MAANSRCAGEKVAELGVCPAATEVAADDVNEGTNGGRISWAIAGTICGGQVQGTHAARLGTCTECDLYQRVVREQGTDLQRAGAVPGKLPRAFSNESGNGPWHQQGP
jgi:hypothetical protein